MPGQHLPDENGPPPPAIPGEAPPRRFRFAAEESALVGRAVAGDVVALQELLLDCHDRLLAAIARGIPDDLRGRFAAEDVLQEAFADTFRQIGAFRSLPDASFFQWVKTIAEHRLLDAIRVHRASKRGGAGRARQARPRSDVSGSMMQLLDLLAADEHTPSRSVARRDAVAALSVALAGLPEDYRQALQLRYLESCTVSEAAERMGRSGQAVRLLCHRALKALREAMGNASWYLTR